MKLQILIFALIGILGQSCMSTNNEIESKIIGIRIFHKKTSAVKSTARLGKAHLRMENDSIEYFMLTSEEITKFNDILIRARFKRHRQQQYIANTMFCEIKYDYTKCKMFDEIEHWGNRLSITFFDRGYLIVDYACMKEYLVKDASDKVWLMELWNRVKLEEE